MVIATNNLSIYTALGEQHNQLWEFHMSDNKGGLGDKVITGRMTNLADSGANRGNLGSGATAETKTTVLPGKNKDTK